MKKKGGESMKFGDYVRIEQKRYKAKNEMYLHKIIGCLNSNYYVDVPVIYPIVEVYHDDVVEVVACVTCGVNERYIHRYKISDVIKEKM